jgi:hypothetical protein
MKITKDNNEAIYIFSWNGGEIIEQHTEQSFLDKYNKNNNPELYNQMEFIYQNKLLCFKIYKMDILEFFENDFLANEDCCKVDNMFIVRL